MKKIIAPAILASLILLAASSAFATRTVTSPYVDEGTLKLKWKGGYTTDDERAARDHASQHKLDAEYGVTKHVALEVEGDIENAGHDDNTNVTGISGKAKFQFTDKGEYFVDPGLRVTYQDNLNGTPDSIEVKFIVAKDMEKFRHIANFIFDHQVGDDAASDTNFGFSWSSRYKWKSYFEPGFELYDNFGSLSDRPDYDDQDHSIGPVVYGKLGENWKYEAGYLRGFSENASDGRFKAVIEYGLKF